MEPFVWTSGYTLVTTHPSKWTLSKAGTKHRSQATGQCFTNTETNQHVTVYKG